MIKILQNPLGVTHLPSVFILIGLLLVTAFYTTLAGLLFFFQAEDGIRDATVTGVQTCALPILMIRHTRCYRDWSSDVCSSDLLDVIEVRDGAPLRRRGPSGRQHREHGSAR